MARGPTYHGKELKPDSLTLWRINHWFEIRMYMPTTPMCFVTPWALEQAKRLDDFKQHLIIKKQLKEIEEREGEEERRQEEIVQQLAEKLVEEERRREEITEQFVREKRRQQEF